MNDEIPSTMTPAAPVGRLSCLWARSAPALVAAGLFTVPVLRAAGGAGDSVLVVFNSRVPESKKVAEYYAGRRAIPADQVLGLDLPPDDTISRADFRDRLQRPLLQALEERQWMTVRNDIKPATQEQPGEILRSVVGAKVRYLVLCYGVPFRILRDPNLVEEGLDRIRPELRRNEAAVDSELALLPRGDRVRLFGPVRNHLYNVPLQNWLHPTNGLLLVARLDGPTPQIARALVDRAIQGETDGLWGRAYFDLRGLSDSNYKAGDDWIRGAAEVARRVGFETVMDENSETFTASFPMSHIALYAGWYDFHVSGPFTRPVVEFMPGAVAYHLHSYSGHHLRLPDHNWAGPLLAKGATATLGCVDEPYLEGTPDVAVFFARLFKGYSFGEAAYAAQEWLSWQTTVVGDPLYQPFSDPPAAQHTRLLERQSKLLEWSHLRAVNLNLATGLAARECIEYLEQQALTRQSAVLQEKLGDLFLLEERPQPAIDAYLAALQLEPSPQQRIRLSLEVASQLAAAGRHLEAYDLYDQFIRDHRDYPGLIAVYRKALPLARKLRKNREAKQFEREIDRLTSSSTKT